MRASLLAAVALSVAVLATVASAARFSGPLDGTYHSSGCESATGVYSVGGYGKRTVTLNAIEFVWRYEHYVDAECRHMDFIVTWEGFVNYNGEVVAGLNAVNMGRNLGTVTPTSPAMVALLTATCVGGARFAINEPTDIENVTCPVVGIMSTQDCPMWYQVGKVMSGQLFMGAQTPALCSLANRPTSIDTGNPLVALPQPIPIWQGIWVEYAVDNTSDCQPGRVPGFSFRSMMQLDSSDFHLKWALYSGDNCDVTATRIMFFMTGQYFVTAASPTISGAYNTQFIVHRTLMLLQDNSIANYMQNMIFNGTVCPYVQVKTQTPIDVSEVDCPRFGMYSVATCPVMYDVMGMRTNYITPYLSTGYLMTQTRNLSCDPLTRATRYGTVNLYNTTPQDVSSLVNAPVAVAVVVTFLLGSLLSGIVFGLCCRHYALKRGARLAEMQGSA